MRAALGQTASLACSLCFLEKEPKFKDAKSGELKYRRRGKIDKKSIDGMFVRLGLFLSDKKDILYKSRDEAVRDLKELLGAKAFIYKPEDVKKEILALARDLRKRGVSPTAARTWNRIGRVWTRSCRCCF